MSGKHSREPGGVAGDCDRLYDHFLALKRRQLLEEFKNLTPRYQAENDYLMKKMLSRVVETRLSVKDVPDFRCRIEFLDDARLLIETGEDLLRDLGADDGLEKGVENGLTVRHSRQSGRPPHYPIRCSWPGTAPSRGIRRQSSSKTSDPRSRSLRCSCRRAPYR